MMETIKVNDIPLLERGAMTLLAFQPCLLHERQGVTESIALQLLRQRLQVMWITALPRSFWEYRLQVVPELQALQRVHTGVSGAYGIRHNKPLTRAKAIAEKIETFAPDVVIVEELTDVLNLRTAQTYKMHDYLWSIKDALRTVPKCAVLLIHKTTARIDERHLPNSVAGSAYVAAVPDVIWLYLLVDDTPQFVFAKSKAGYEPLGYD